MWSSKSTLPENVVLLNRIGSILRLDISRIMKLVNVCLEWITCLHCLYDMYDWIIDLYFVAPEEFWNSFINAEISQSNIYCSAANFFATFAFIHAAWPHLAWQSLLQEECQANLADFLRLPFCKESCGLTTVPCHHHRHQGPLWLTTAPPPLHIQPGAASPRPLLATSTIGVCTRTIRGVCNAELEYKQILRAASVECVNDIHYFMKAISLYEEYFFRFLPVISEWIWFLSVARDPLIPFAQLQVQGNTERFVQLMIFAWRDSGNFQNMQSRGRALQPLPWVFATHWAP